MLGPEGVGRSVTARLKNSLPLMVEDHRERYNATPLDFPAPEVANIHPTVVDVVGIGDYPAVMVSVGNMGGRAAPTRNSDVGGAFAEYHFRYRVTVYFYVHASDYGPTDAQRMRLMLAIRETLFRDLRLMESATEKININELTYAEELEGGIGEVEGKKLIGSGACIFEVHTTERMELPTGPIVELEHDVEVVHPGAPLPHQVDLD